MPEAFPATTQPASMADLLGPPPIITGELASAFEELLERAREILKSAGIIEEMWVRDVVNLEWENLRDRRLKSNLLQASQYAGLERVLTPITGMAEAEELSLRWAKRDPTAVAQVDQLLASAGLGMDAVMAETFAARMRELDCMERMIASREARRAEALRELARHREASAARLKDGIKKVEDAEYEDIEPQDAAPKPRT
jgi:hypothetical protein